MRRIILVFPIIIFGSYFSSAQNNYLPFLTKEEQQLKYRINRLINSEKLDSIDYQIMYQSKVPYQKEDTSIYRSLIMKYIDSLNRTKPYEIMGSIGLNNLEDFKNSFGTFTIGARFRISKYKPKPRNPNLPVRALDPGFAYFEYRTRTALGSDTNTLAKTFLFPQMNKQDYVFGFYNQVSRNNWDFWLPIFEISLNRYSDKENKNYFTSEAAMFGIRAHKNFSTATTGGSWVMFMPYYKIINVDPKHRSSYNLLLGEASLPLTFHTVGLEMAFGPQNAAFFCNMNYILNKDKGIKNPELIRFVYTVGVRALLSSNRFQIYWFTNSSNSEARPPTIVFVQVWQEVDSFGCCSLFYYCSAEYMLLSCCS